MEKGKFKFGPLVVVSAGSELTPEAIGELERVGFEVTVCADPKRAFNLEALKPNRWTPTVFVVDVSIPQSSGFEVVRRLNEKYSTKKIPILMMSQHTAQEDILEATNAGAVGLIKKPLSPQVLEDMFESSP